MNSELEGGKRGGEQQKWVREKAKETEEKENMIRNDLRRRVRTRGARKTNGSMWRKGSRSRMEPGA